jgi:Ca2+-binding EF-hand superfamily protein
LSPPKQNSKVVHRRLSPLKENSPSKPSPISTEFIATTEDNRNNRPSRNRNNDSAKRTNQDNHHRSTTTLRVQEQQHQQQSSSSSSPLGFSQAETQELHESFQLFDIDNTGSIAVGDLRSILKTLQSEYMQPRQPLAAVRCPHLDNLLHHLSSLDDEEQLTLDDYMNLMASTTISSAMATMPGGDQYNAENGDNHNYAHVFRLFDLDGKGYIDIQDLERVALELGEHDMTREELQEMIERAVSNTNHTPRQQQQLQHRVGLKEFTRMMTMNMFPPKRDEPQQSN